MQRDLKNLDQDLMQSVNLIMRALLVSAKKGAPAEGRLPFNPLYFNLLRVIGQAGPIRPSKIADHFDIPRSTVSTAAKALQSRQLVKAQTDPADRRAVQLELTEDGKATLEAILRQDLRNSQAMLAALPEEDRTKFVGLMARIAAGLNGS